MNLSNPFKSLRGRGQRAYLRLPFRHQSNATSDSGRMINKITKTTPAVPQSAITGGEFP